MKEKITAMMQEVKEKMAQAASAEDVEAMRIRFLGKKGELTEILRSMKDLAPEERKTMGQLANEARANMEAMLQERMAQFKAVQYSFHSSAAISLLRKVEVRHV